MNWRGFIFLSLLFASCSKEAAVPTPFYLTRYAVDGDQSYAISDAGLNPVITASFSSVVDPTTIDNVISIFDNGTPIHYKWSISNNDSTITISPTSPLKPLTKYDFVINNQLKSYQGVELASTLNTTFNTKIDSTDKFPIISDEKLLDLVQSQTFKYFWDFGHPYSGLARERNTSGNLVTSGGSGFGIMGIIVGIKRGFITREKGLERILKITNFLHDKADRFHGAFSHWLDGNTGKVIAFSPRDNGGDLVETSFLIAGLLTAKEYFDQNSTTETELRTKIQSIWEGVEWNWFTKDGGNILYWHWSPNFNWDMNLPVRGWNESLITYVLAASSPTHPINKAVYENGWARNGGMKNGKSFYGITLPLGEDLGGPLFFAHYSFLGIKPFGLKDQYGDYDTQVTNHSLINYNYCIANPRRFSGYSTDCWGLTASDTNNGYTAHSPTNDRGVITPTAALSSMPYTPTESMRALKFFYYKLGDRTFKEFGFIDAFNLTNIWFASSFLAIDQGPILVMIENHRSGLIWDYMMKNTDVQQGLDKLGFTY